MGGSATGGVCRTCVLGVFFKLFLEEFWLFQCESIPAACASWAFVLVAVCEDDTAQIPETHLPTPASPNSTCREDWGMYSHFLRRRPTLSSEASCHTTQRQTDWYPVKNFMYPCGLGRFLGRVRMSLGQGMRQFYGHWAERGVSPLQNSCWTLTLFQSIPDLFNSGFSFSRFSLVIQEIAPLPWIPRQTRGVIETLQRQTVGLPFLGPRQQRLRSPLYVSPFLVP